MIIYKYLDEDGAEATIEDNSILLKCPTEFNDPFDCLFCVDPEDKKEAYKLFINNELFKEFYKKMIVKNQKPNIKKDLAREIKQSIQKSATIIKKTKVFEMQSYLLQLLPLAPQHLKKDETKLRSEFNHMIKNKMEEIRSIALVACFGSTFDSILMWSHYANKHKGACIEFEIDDKDFKNVTYSEKLPLFRLTDILKIIFGHQFAGAEIDAEKEEFKFILDPLLTKSKDWEYEGEVRCVYSSKNRDSKIKDSFNKNGEPIILLDMPRIKKIYLGCKAEKSFVSKIKSISGDIPIYKMKLCKNKYGLTVEHK